MLFRSGIERVEEGEGRHLNFLVSKNVMGKSQLLRQQSALYP
jgi:hypothetical protein